MKDPKTYEHVRRKRSATAARAGLRPGGKSNCWPSSSASGIAVDKDDPRLDALLDEVKEREARATPTRRRRLVRTAGRRACSAGADYFDVEQLPTSTSSAAQRLGELVTVSEAVVKVKVGGER
jgi:2-isopropylmalate synthase